MDKKTDAEYGKVNHPEYYQGKHECIDEMIALFGREAVKSFCRCNAFKYRYRAGRKPGEEAAKDLAKAEWYIDKLMQMLDEDRRDYDEFVM